MKKVFRTLKEKAFGRTAEESLLSFRALFEKFRELLAFNNRILELIADMGDKLSGDYVFDTHYLDKIVNELDDLVYRLIYNLNAITGNRNLALYDTFERIRTSIRSELVQDSLPAAGGLVSPLAEVDLDLADLAGGKMGALGEVQSRLEQRVPPGFVITTHGYRRFVGQKGIGEQLGRAYEELDAGAEPARVSEEIRSAIEKASLPEDLDSAIKGAVRRLEEEGHKYFAVRSSALGEDSELSFAGQYRSFLQVAPARLADRYKEVVSSLFSPEAIVYRREHGIRHQGSAMAVGVLAMVEPSVSGVLYTRDPEAPDQDVMLVSAAWGLARTVVEGRSGTDFYRLARRGSGYDLIQSRIGEKQKQLVPDPKLGEGEEPVSVALQKLPCLSHENLQRLAEIGDQIEFYFKRPQDIEWAIDDAQDPVILQSRPLRVRAVERVGAEEIKKATMAHPRLMEGAGMVACGGIGAGKVIRVLSEEDFDRFQRGSVLVARTTSPNLSRLIPLSSAVVTDIGTPTGHMATIAREYRVPTLVDTGEGTQRLEEGMEVTVDAEERVIYQGIVKELRFQTLMEPHFADIREFRILRRLLKKISPLRLTDPQSSEFSPQNCRTYHDIARFSHEIAVSEFINLHLRGRRWKRIPTRRLSIPIPLGLVVIDIDGGIASGATGRVVKPEQIVSHPLRSLLEGLCEEGVWRTEPVDLDFRSFMTSFTRTSNTATVDPGEAQNLAVISQDYMNLNLRLGYHFNMIDTIMTENRNDNYIYFRFLGGVTDIARRSRRAKFLAEVLNHHDFLVEVKGDMVVARVRKLSMKMMETRLAMLGRLIGYARQLDVLMRSDETVNKFVRHFLYPESSDDPIPTEAGGIP